MDPSWGSSLKRKRHGKYFVLSPANLGICVLGADQYIDIADVAPANSFVAIFGRLIFFRAVVALTTAASAATVNWEACYSPGRARKVTPFHGSLPLLQKPTNQDDGTISQQ